MASRTVILAGLLALAVVVTAPWAAAAPKNENNAGTIKVHDNATADPEVRNQPHVSCDFWVEGFNMEDDSGSLVFQAWPPTGDKSVVTPTGDSLDWSADAGNSHGNYHFLKGAYELPVGHYKVTSTDGEGKQKSKVFWVDPCLQLPPPCTENCVPTPPCTSDCTPPPCTTDCTPPPCTQDCTPPTTQIPFFPSTGSLVMGVLGAAGSVGAIVLRRRT